MGKLKSIFDRRKVQVLAISRFYAARMLQDFRTRQGMAPNSQGEFWFNNTSQAARRMTATADIEGDIIRLVMAHGVAYGPNLELGNDGRHAAIKPIIDKWKDSYLAAVRSVYAD